jgi:hypothetical protein
MKRRGVNTMPVISNASHFQSGWLWPGYYTRSYGHFLYWCRKSLSTWPICMRSLPPGIKTGEVNHLPPPNVELGIQTTSPSGAVFIVVFMHNEGFKCTWKEQKQAQRGTRTTVCTPVLCTNSLTMHYSGGVLAALWNIHQSGRDPCIWMEY